MKKLAIVGITTISVSIAGAGCSGGGLGDPAAESDLGANVGALCTGTLDPGTKFFVPKPDAGAVRQVADLLKSKHLVDAARIAAMGLTPQAVWFTGGTPTDVQRGVRKIMAEAALEKRVSVLVSYNVPFRDCAQYSAGGAVDTVAYEAWIDGFAAGIGKGKAVVILEPDSVGIIPFHTNLDGTEDWCQPKDASGNPQPGASATERFVQLNYAINSIRTHAPNALVYLDATHSDWLGVPEATNRLLQAGIQNANGFYLNVSNYQYTANSIQYGTWISRCIASYPSLDDDHCANKWWNGGPATGWNGTAMSPHGEWSSGAADLALNTAGIDSRYANVAGPTPTTHFVIDTSRNGQGPLDASVYAAAPYNQPASAISGLNGGNWCNPYGAGLGLRPTANTGVALLDAYLWVKLPGESDGSCDIAGGARAWDFGAYDIWPSTIDENHFDPLWGMVDPAAGAWFPEQALQLAQKANPPLL